MSQVAIMPLAFITALFRPFIFESFTAMQFLNAIEMTWLLVILREPEKAVAVAKPAEPSEPSVAKATHSNRLESDLS